MTGTGTALDPYIITTRVDLEAVNDDLTAYYELGADIDLAGTDWIPIGWIGGYDFADGALWSSFYGTFNGAHHKIKNMTIAVNDTDIWDIGLFSDLSAATITDLSICDARIDLTVAGASNTEVGLLAGGAGAATISGCTVAGAIYVNSTGTTVAPVTLTGVGGIIGGGATVTISDCMANLVFTSEEGLVPPTTMVFTRLCDIGGIAGKLRQTSSIEDCRVTVSANAVTDGAESSWGLFGASELGGVVGLFDPAAGSYTLAISGCFVTVHLHSYAYGGWNVTRHGGIVGAYQCAATPTTESLTVTDSRVSGFIQCNQLAGGILGAMDDFLADAGLLSVTRCGIDIELVGMNYLAGICSEPGRIAAYTDCYAIGTITSTTGTTPPDPVQHVAGIGFGETIIRCYSAITFTFPDGATLSDVYALDLLHTGNTVTGCYYDATLEATLTGLKATGKTTAEMQTQSTFTGWDFDAVWNIAGGAYPFLRTAFVTIRDWCKAQSNAVWFQLI
jgi:hypothetical protein